MNCDYGANNEEGECLEIFRSYRRGIRGMLLSDRAGTSGLQDRELSLLPYKGVITSQGNSVA